MGNVFSQRRSTITYEQENFTRFGKAIVGIGTKILQEILETYIPSKDIAIKVTSASHPNVWGRLNQQQRLLIGQAAADGYKDFDITLCYTLLRNLNVHAPFPKPTRGWGTKPSATDTTQSDDIERIRILRNEMFGHHANPSISIVEFTDIWNQLKDVCTRMKARLPNGTDFLKELRTLESCQVSSVQWDSIVKLVKQMREYSIQIDAHGTQLDEHTTHLATLDTEVDRHDTQLDEHSTQLDRLDTGVQSHGTQLDEHERHLDSLDESCQNHETQIANIKEQLKSDQHNPGDKQSIKNLRERLIEINNDKTRVIPLSPLLERGEDELPIEQLYAQVVIQEDPKYKEKGHDSSHSTKEVTDPDDIFTKDGEVVKKIFMTGDSGRGKTIFCLWLLKNWCNALQKNGSDSEELDKWEKKLKEFDFVFLIQLGDFHDVQTNIASVIDMICQVEFESDTDHHATIRHVLSSNQYRSLIIIDGLDEWNPNEETRKHLIHDRMPKLDLSSTVSCFIAMRPWVLSTMSKIVKISDRVIEIFGLNDASIEIVIKNVLINRYKLVKESEKCIYECNKIFRHFSEKKLKSFMQIPLLTVVCVQMLYEKKQLGDSMTSFYAEMLNMLIERANEKHVKLKVGPSSSLKCDVPKVFCKHKTIQNCISVLSKLGEVAYEGLLSNETNIVLQKIELEEQISDEELQFILNVGFISQREASSRTEKKVSIHFFHKSIQEFLAAFHIVTNKNKEVGASFCKHLSDVNSIMELSNVIMFICGMSPSLGSVISQHAARVTDSDTTICRYRESPGPSCNEEGLCEIQIGWYRELQDRETESPVTFHISDVYHNVDVEKMSVIRKILSDHNVLGIRSLYLYKNARFGVHTVSESSITNTELNDFLLNKYNNTMSLIEVCINGRYCVPTIFIPTLRKLHLIHVSIDNSPLDVDICPPFFTHVSSLRVLRMYNVTVGNRGLDLSELTSLRLLKLTSMALGDKGLDLSAMTSLQKLSLFSVPLGERGLYLSTNMVNLKEVSLWYEVLSAAQWEQFILSAINIQHRFDVELWSTNIDDESITRIRSSPHFIVTREERYTSVGGNDEHTFFFTRVTRYDDDGNEILYTRLQEKPNIKQ